MKMTEAEKFQKPKRKGQRPICPLNRFERCDAGPVDKAAMLIFVLFVMRAQRFAIRVETVKKGSFEFVIAHYGVGAPIGNQRTVPLQDGRVAGLISPLACVNKVAKKSGPGLSRCFAARNEACGSSM